MVSGCRLLMWILSVPRFFLILDRWVSRLNGFTLDIFGAPYGLLFGVNQGSVTVENRTLTGLLSQIAIWMESCLIGTHTSFSYIF